MFLEGTMDFIIIIIKKRSESATVVYGETAHAYL
jgi:hypothetical protein